MAAKKTKSDTAAPLFTKAQLANAKTFGFPHDAINAVLKDGVQYTKEQAARLLSDFLKRKV